MKMKYNLYFVLLLLITTFVWINCGDDSNPMSSTTLSGTWTFVSLTDKAEGTTLTPGDEITTGITLVSGQIDATDSDFTLTFTVSIGGTENDLAAQGTYELSGTELDGSELTITITESTIPDIEPGTIVFDLSLDGDELTLENAENRIVVRR